MWCISGNNKYIGNKSQPKCTSANDLYANDG